MDMNKEKEAFEAWAGSKGKYIQLSSNGEYVSMTLNEEWQAWQAAKNHANQQFESFLNQAIEDSACADERRSLQVLLEDFQDNLEADNRQGQKRVAVNLEDL
jgi:hypothetical protein